MTVLQLSYKLQNLAQADLELFEFANGQHIELGAFALSLMFLGFKYQQNLPKTFLTEPNILHSLEVASISIRINVDAQLDKRFHKHLSTAKQGKSRRQVITGLIHAGINCFYELQYLLNMAIMNNDTQLTNATTTVLHSHALSNIQHLHATLHNSEKSYNPLYLKDKYQEIVKYSSTYALETVFLTQPPSPINHNSPKIKPLASLEPNHVEAKTVKPNIKTEVVSIDKNIEAQPSEKIHNTSTVIKVQPNKNDSSSENKSEPKPEESNWLSCFDVSKL